MQGVLTSPNQLWKECGGALLKESTALFIHPVECYSTGMNALNSTSRRESIVWVSREKKMSDLARHLYDRCRTERTLQRVGKKEWTVKERDHSTFERVGTGAPPGEQLGPLCNSKGSRYSAQLHLRRRSIN